MFESILRIMLFFSIRTCMHDRLMFKIFNNINDDFKDAR